MGVTGTTDVPAFHMDAGEPHLGLHACEARILLNEHPPDNSFNIF